MFSLLAGSASCLGLHNGAGWSRERSHPGLLQSVSGWPISSSQKGAEAPALLLRDLRSLPHAILLESASSLIDVMQEKWCAELCIKNAQFRSSVVARLVARIMIPQPSSSRSIVPCELHFAVTTPLHLGRCGLAAPALGAILLCWHMRCHALPRIVQPLVVRTLERVRCAFTRLLPTHLLPH